MEKSQGARTNQEARMTGKVEQERKFDGKEKSVGFTLNSAGDLASVFDESLLCLLAACIRLLMASNDCLFDLTKASMHL